MLLLLNKSSSLNKYDPCSTLTLTICTIALQFNNNKLICSLTIGCITNIILIGVKRMIDEYVNIINEKVNKKKIELQKEDEEKYEDVIDKYNEYLYEYYNFIGEYLSEEDFE